jgi:hypothetical protein
LQKPIALTRPIHKKFAAMTKENCASPQMSTIFGRGMDEDNALAAAFSTSLPP